MKTQRTQKKTKKTKNLVGYTTETFPALTSVREVGLLLAQSRGKVDTQLFKSV